MSCLATWSRKEPMFDRQPLSMALVTLGFVRTLGSAALLALCAACGGGGGAPDVVQPQVAFSSIAPLPGDVSNQPTALSADGTVVVGFSTSPSGKTQAFRWSATDGMTGLGFMAGGTSSSAHGVSADGTVVLGDGNADAVLSAVFRWSAKAGLVPLKSLANSTICVAGGLSGDGATVVGTCLVFGNTAFRWTEGTGMVALSRFGTGSNQTSNAFAISADASTVVGIGHAVLTGAVLWNAAGEGSILGLLPGDTATGASAVSRDGSVVIGNSTQASSQRRPFRWTRQTGMNAMASTSGPFTEVNASAVSGDGRLIVGWGSTAAGETALIWDETHGMRRLEDMLKIDYQTTFAGWTLSRATAISDDGHSIAGVGVNPNGITEGWLVKLPG